MTDLASDFHEITTTADHDALAAVTTDVRHKNPYDRHKAHIWMFEEEVATGVLTQDGITQIAHHQYVSGVYTTLDTLLNPMWVRLTELLPRTMAPNMVTTIGGMHGVVAYIITWLFGTEHFRDSDEVPSWLFLFNGFCMIAYYTLDCMDGKQARRTGTSSPLGQLFDHGMDSLCLQQHLSMSMSVVLPGNLEDPSRIWWYFGAQWALQISFFIAQWEEYYTGQLPHAAGNMGVTEMSYGMAAFSILNGIIDRSIYLHPLEEFIPINPAYINGLQFKHLLIMLWYLFVVWQIGMSYVRVMKYMEKETMAMKLSALGKWVSPVVIASSPFILPTDILARETRLISLSVGLALTVITNKMIVFSMARQAYAIIQWRDVVAIFVPCLWIANDSKWTEKGIHALWQVLAIHFTLRILLWTAAATSQICQRMDIYLFSIKHPTAETKKAE